MDTQYTNIILFSLITSFSSSVLELILFVVKSIFVSWIEIDNMNPESDKVYEWLTLYFSQKTNEGKLFTITSTVETATSLNTMWYDPDSESSITQVRFVPGESWSVVFEKNEVIFFQTEYRESRSEGSSNVVNKKVVLYKPLPILLSIIGTRPWSSFIETIKTNYEQMVNRYQCIYKNDGDWWGRPMLTDVSKINEGIFIPTEEMLKLFKNVEQFILPKTRKMYKEKGLHYCKRICVYGPPGTGKSNFAVRLAGEFNFPIYYLNSRNLSNCSLLSLFNNVQRGIIIIEEIDKCINELTQYENDKIMKGNSKNSSGFPTLSVWHQALDKIIGRQVIVYMTTNNLHSLQELNHGSLIRGERIDNLVHFGYVNNDEIEQMVNKYHNTEFALKDIKSTKTTAADILSLLKSTNLENIQVEIQKLISTKTIKVHRPKNILISYIEKLSSKQIEEDSIICIVKILEENGVKTEMDAELILKDSTYYNKILQNGNLSIIDEIKFKGILKSKFQ